jgi:hypothetical protein
MGKMLKYMVVHEDPHVSWEKVEENWGKLANVEHATWVRTCFNKQKGVRYCVWLAPSEDVLKSIFAELEISWVSMLEVEETVPDLWGKKWEEHLAAEAEADTLGF